METEPVDKFDRFSLRLCQVVLKHISADLIPQQSCLSFQKYVCNYVLKCLMGVKARRGPFLKVSLQTKNITLM